MKWILMAFALMTSGLMASEDHQLVARSSSQNSEGLHSQPDVRLTEAHSRLTWEEKLFKPIRDAQEKEYQKIERDLREKEAERIKIEERLRVGAIPGIMSDVQDGSSDEYSIFASFLNWLSGNQEA